MHFSSSEGISFYLTGQSVNIIFRCLGWIASLLAMEILLNTRSWRPKREDSRASLSIRDCKGQSGCISSPTVLLLMYSNS